MGISPSQFEAMAARVDKNRVRDSKPLEEAKDAPESALHESIRAYCDAQWPRFKYLHCRMDMPSTIAVGAQDFTIFIPAAKVLCIECKRKGQKATAQQNSWAAEMSKLGHSVHIVTSMNEFMDVLKGAMT